MFKRLDKELHSASLGQIEIRIGAGLEKFRNYPFNRFVQTILPLDLRVC
jgi:hypothetical protein